MSHFFGVGGNPFGTQIGQMIEKATDGSQASENWGLYMEVCDMINETEDGPKDAIKAIKKRLSHNSGKNFQVIMYTLTLLETCVKNGGRRFHVQVAHKDFLQEMVKVIGPKNDPPQIVQEKVLSLIQTWADAFQGIAELKEAGKVYQDLKQKGIEFPATDLDHMVPIHTPARTAPGVDPVVPVPQRTPSARSHPRSPPRTQTMPYPTQQFSQVMPPAQQQIDVQPGPVLLSPEQLAKLKSELDIVQQNVKVFSEMLTELTPAQEHPADRELLMDLNSTCREMQRRIMDLIERVQNEEVTGELLRMNDELNNVFLRYDRFERLRSSQMGSSVVNTPATATTQQPPAALQPPPGRQDISHDPPPYPAADTGVGNLIDLGDAAAPQSTVAANSSDISFQLAGMNLSSGTVSGTLNQLDTTTAMNAGPADDDFDMFAQSRKSFDQNKQNPTEGYTNQVYDQYTGSLGAAVSAKSTGNAQLIDKESDYDEMEKWLKENPKQGQDTATSSEFENFLAQRAQEVDNLPDAASNGSQQRQNRAPRQMQKDDSDNSALFAL